MCTCTEEGILHRLIVRNVLPLPEGSCYVRGESSRLLVILDSHNLERKTGTSKHIDSSVRLRDHM